jgi:CHASE1-domain containing sensor protein
VWGWALGVFAVGLISSALLALAQREHNASTANAALTAALDSTTRQILARVRLYQYGLRGARGAVLAAGEAQLNQATFRRYSESRDTQAEFPGARGFASSAACPWQPRQLSSRLRAPEARRISSSASSPPTQASATSSNSSSP